MICSRCKMIMGTGTRYEKRKEQHKPYHKRYFECKKCYDRFYINVPNFHEMLARESEKRLKKI